MAEKVQEGFEHPCWAVVRQSEDGSGTWIAHCLDFDVVTFGESPEQVMKDIAEMAGEVIVDDLSRDVSPLERRAPTSDWALLRKVLKVGEKLQNKAELDAFVARASAPVFVISFGIAIELAEPVGVLPTFESETNAVFAGAAAA